MKTIDALPASLLSSVLRTYKGAAVCEDNDLYYKGAASLHFRKGQVYEGDVALGVMEGKGTYTWPCGTVYEGEWQRNNPHGNGCMTWTAHNLTYRGHFESGKRHGIGELFVGEVVVYSGQWSNGRKHGQGTMRYIPEGATYSGGWKEDKRHGEGKMVYANGNVYEGVWAEDEKCGFGVMEWATLGQRYEGEWLADKPHGYGVHVWKKDTAKELTEANYLRSIRCNQYHGMWKEGMREGRGRFLYSDGSCYEGEWKQNLKHGFGKRTSRGGLVYEGEYVQDRAQDGSKASQSVDKRSEFWIREYFCEDREGVVRDASGELGNALVRWRTTLRKIYYKVGRVKEKSSNPEVFDYCMTSAELENYLASANVFCERLRRDWYRLLVENSVEIKHDSGNLIGQDSQCRLLFRHFLAVIVHCAALKYHNIGTDLSEKLDAFLNHISRIKKAEVVEFQVDESPQKSAFKLLSLSHHSPIAAVFTPLTPRNLISKLKQLGLFDTGLMIQFPEEAVENEEGEDLRTGSEKDEPPEEDAVAASEENAVSLADLKYCISFKQALQSMTKVVMKAEYDESVEFNPEILDYPLDHDEFAQILTYLAKDMTLLESECRSAEHPEDALYESLVNMINKKVVEASSNIECASEELEKANQT